MRQSAQLIVSAFAVFFTSTAAVAATPWDCTKFAEVTNSGGALLSLDACISPKGYNGRIKWGLTNHTNAMIYSVSIADKVYTLSSGRVVKRSGETLSSKIAPGETKFTMSDAVNTAEKNYKNNPVIKISLKQPMIKFATEKRGKRTGWESLGVIK